MSRLAEPYAALLRALEAAPVRFALLGTAGLALRYPAELARYALPDVDLLLDPAHEHALRAARTAEAQGWEVRVWGERPEGGWTAESLLGRKYLRARRGSLTADLTYECETLDATAALARASRVDGVPVCALEDLWVSRLRARWEPTLAFARAHGLRIPEEALERAGSGRPG